jgi:hypothetical protein
MGVTGGLGGVAYVSRLPSASTREGGVGEGVPSGVAVGGGGVGVLVFSGAGAWLVMETESGVREVSPAAVSVWMRA